MLCAAVLQIASLRYDFNLKFDHTIRFQDIHLDEDATLILDLTTATQAYHGHRIGAFHNERRKKLPSWTGGVAAALEVRGGGIARGRHSLCELISPSHGEA